MYFVNEKNKKNKKKHDVYDILSTLIFSMFTDERRVLF